MSADVSGCQRYLFRCIIFCSLCFRTWSGIRFSNFKGSVHLAGCPDPGILQEWGFLRSFEFGKTDWNLVPGSKGTPSSQQQAGTSLNHFQKAVDAVESALLRAAVHLLSSAWVAGLISADLSLPELLRLLMLSSFAGRKRNPHTSPIRTVSQ